MGAPGPFSFGAATPPGSPHWVAPEVINQRKYGPTADLYAFGVIIWQLLTGGVEDKPGLWLPPCQPYMSMDFRPLAKNWRLLHQCVRKPDSWGARRLPSPEAEDLVVRLTHKRPCRRIQHEEVRCHGFMRP